MKAHPSLPMLPFKVKAPQTPVLSVHDCNFKPGDEFTLSNQRGTIYRVETIRRVDYKFPYQVEEDFAESQQRFKIWFSCAPLPPATLRMQHTSDAEGFHDLWTDHPAGDGMIVVTTWEPSAPNVHYPPKASLRRGFDMRHATKVRGKK